MASSGIIVPTSLESKEANTPPIVNEEVSKSEDIPVPTETMQPADQNTTLESNDLYPPIVNQEAPKSEENPVPTETMQPIDSYTSNANEQTKDPFSELSSTTPLPEEVSKSINTVMEFVTSKIANKINLDVDKENYTGNVSKIQNGFDAVNEANEKIMATSQNGGKTKKFRLTKKSRGK